MFKVCGSIEMSVDDIKNCIKGSQLLSSKMSYERSKKNLHPVYVDEAYFIRYAISSALDALEDEYKIFNEN